MSEINMGAEGKCKSPERFSLKPERVTIIGAGISGLVTAYCLLKKGIKVTLIDTRNPLNEKNTPSCGGCGGLIQNQTIDLLHEIDLHPEKDSDRQIIRDYPLGYEVYFPAGKVLTLPLKDQTMWTMCRGFGPIGDGNKQIGIDGWLFEQVQKIGKPETFEFIQGKVAKVELGVEKKANIRLTSDRTISTDFVVDASGAKSSLSTGSSIKYQYPDGVTPMDSPEVRRSLTMEFRIDKPDENKSRYIRVVTIPDKDSNVWFAAVIPKGRHVTLVLMGKNDVKTEDVPKFMQYLRDNKIKILPKNIVDNVIENGAKLLGCTECLCNQGAIVVKPSQKYLVDAPGGAVKVGDQGSTKVFKDGIGGAVQSAKLIADAIAQGDFQQSQEKLREIFPPNDYFYAQVIIGINDLMLRFPHIPKLLSFIGKNKIPLLSHLMDVYMGHLLTGDIPYKDMIPMIKYLIDPLIKIM